MMCMLPAIHAFSMMEDDETMEGETRDVDRAWARNDGVCLASVARFSESRLANSPMKIGHFWPLFFYHKTPPPLIFGHYFNAYFHGSGHLDASTFSRNEKVLWLFFSFSKKFQKNYQSEQIQPKLKVSMLWTYWAGNLKLPDLDHQLKGGNQNSWDHTFFVTQDSTVLLPFSEILPFFWHFWK